MVSLAPPTPPNPVVARPAHYRIDEFGADILRAVPPVLDLHQDTAISISLIPVEGDLAVKAGLTSIREDGFDYPGSHPLAVLSRRGGRMPAELVTLNHLVMMESRSIAVACLPALRRIPHDMVQARYVLWMARTVALFRPASFYDGKRDYSEWTAVFTPSATSAHETLHLARKVQDDYARITKSLPTFNAYTPEFLFPTPGAGFDAT